MFTGADDLEQLTELSEEEFTQLCAMIGMDKKPFHVLRFRKALEKPPPPSGVPLNQSTVNPTPHTSTAITVTPPIVAAGAAACTSMSTPAVASSGYFSQPQAPLSLPASCSITAAQPPPINVLHHPAAMPMATMQGVMVTAAMPQPQQLHPQTHGQPSRALLEALNASEAKYGPPKIMLQQPDTSRSKASLPPYLMPNSECRTFDDLVDDRTPIQKALGPPPFSPSIWDSDRRELIRRYSAIYGKSGGDRRQKEAFSDFEIHINEAAFQLCLRDPTLLVRREELYILAKRAVKEGGYAYYHGFSKTKESLNSLTSGSSSNALNSSAMTSGAQKHPRSVDTDSDEANMPPTKLISLKTALNIPSKLSVKRRLEHMQELENLIAENKSQQAVKLAALERAQQNGDFSTAYSIQLDVESLGMTCEQLQTAYTTLKKRQYRSVRYFKKKQDKETTSDVEVPTATNSSSVSTPGAGYVIRGASTSTPTDGPIQLIDTSILFSSPSITSPMTSPVSASASGSSSVPPKLSHKNQTTKGRSSRNSVRPSSTVTATIIPSTSSQHQQRHQQQFDTRTHTVTVTVPSQDDSSDQEVRNLVENVSHATDEVNSLMIREQLTWEDLQ